jgi:hypothetical protein
VCNVCSIRYCNCVVCQKGTRHETRTAPGSSGNLEICVCVLRANPSLLSVSVVSSVYSYPGDPSFGAQLDSFKTGIPYYVFEDYIFCSLLMDMGLDKVLVVYSRSSDLKRNLCPRGIFIYISIST